MLLSLKEFENIFNPLKNRKICLVIPSGNVGDKLILEGCLNLFSKFDIKYDMVPSDRQVFLKGHDLWTRFDDYDDIGEVFTR